MSASGSRYASNAVRGRGGQRQKGKASYLRIVLFLRVRLSHMRGTGGLSDEVARATESPGLTSYQVAHWADEHGQTQCTLFAWSSLAERASPHLSPSTREGHLGQQGLWSRFHPSARESFPEGSSGASYSRAKATKLVSSFWGDGVQGHRNCLAGSKFLR